MIPGDDELDRQLEADLDRPLTDDDSVVDDSDTERAKEAKSATTKGKRVPSREIAAPSQEIKAGFAMFDPSPHEPDEAMVEAELQALETEMEVFQPAEEINVPKKGRKPGPRKVSKQTKKGKAAAKPEAEHPPEPVPEPATEPTEDNELMDDHDASTATVVIKASAETAAPTKRGRGRPARSDVAHAEAAEEAAGTPRPPIGHPTSMDPNVEETVAVQEAPSTSKESPGRIEALPRTAIPREGRPLPRPPRSQETNLAVPPATPRANHISSAPSAKQATISPSPSPQSSDAENQPPSSKPSYSTTAKHLVLAPVPEATTPVRSGSPSKRAVNTHVIGGLQSAFPWTAVDLELAFGGENKENGDEVDALLQKGTDLATPEKRMTVEEWIYYNASQAEKRLKHECEAMVSSFEREGTRAMRVLEELVVD